MKTITVYTEEEFEAKWPTKEFGWLRVQRKARLHQAKYEFEDEGYWQIVDTDPHSPLTVSDIERLIESLKQAKEYCEGRP